MKKWFYVLAPSAMLGVFLFFYFASKAETEAREKAKQEEVAKAKAEADEKKHLAEVKAHEDAERRAAEQAADEAAKAKAKQDKYDTLMARIKEDTARANASSEKYAAEVSEKTILLEALRKQKDTLTRDSFELQKKIELSQVARRNAELDIQRTIEFIANHADQSAMTKMPPAPPPKDS